MAVMRWLILAVAVPFFLVDGFAIYRRLNQLRRLDLQVSDAELRDGSAVILDASSWATTMMTVRLELVQGARSETLLLHRLPPNEEATLDPRPRSARLRVVLTADLLARYAAGEAVLRATATWRAQLLRTSRPVIREVAVRIIPGSASPRSRSSRRGAYVGARPLAVHQPPRAPAGVLVAQQGGEAGRPHVVVRVQRGEPAERCRDAHGGEPWMSRGWIRPAVIHRRTDRHARRHLVVQQSADALSERRLEPSVERFVAAARVRVDAAGQVPFELGEDREHLLRVASDDRERHVPERLRLERVRLGEKSLSAHAQQRVRVAIARSLDRRPAGDDLGARAPQLRHARRE
jgi:hypothetical protein